MREAGLHAQHVGTRIDLVPRHPPVGAVELTQVRFDRDHDVARERCLDSADGLASFAPTHLGIFRSQVYKWCIVVANGLRYQRGFSLPKYVRAPSMRWSNPDPAGASVARSQSAKPS